MSELIPLPTRPVAVTFFEDRAEVVRRATPTLPAGASWVALSGVSPFVDDRSVQARAKAARVLQARVRRIVRLEPMGAPGGESIELLETAAERGRDRAVQAHFARERAENEARRCEALGSSWTAALASPPRLLADAERSTGWREAEREIDRAMTAALERLQVARLEVERAEIERQRAEDRLREARRLEPRCTALVEVQLESAAAAEVELEIVYRTPGALWRPEHVAELSAPPAAPATIAFTTHAVAWQCTGELWEEVDAFFSTARTASNAAAPMLADDTLRLRTKTPHEQRQVLVEAREQEILETGIAGQRQVGQMPGVDDGGRPQTFHAAGKVSFASDGRPFRVEIARRTLEAKVALVAYPERAAAAHLRATSRLAGEGALLAGPIVMMREGCIVGRARVGFIAAGEPFELGFGVEDGVRVRRVVTESRDTTAITGTQKHKHTVQVFLSNLGAARRQVELTERVPVSEIEEVQVNIESSDWKVDRDGLARRLVELAPLGQGQFELAYEVRAASNVTME